MRKKFVAVLMGFILICQLSIISAYGQLSELTTVERLFEPVDKQDRIDPNRPRYLIEHVLQDSTGVVDYYRIAQYKVRSPERISPYLRIEPTCLNINYVDYWGFKLEQQLPDGGYIYIWFTFGRRLYLNGRWKTKDKAIFIIQQPTHPSMNVDCKKCFRLT